MEQVFTLCIEKAQTNVFVNHVQQSLLFGKIKIVSDISVPLIIQIIPSYK